MVRNGLFERSSAYARKDANPAAYVGYRVGMDLEPIVQPTHRRGRFNVRVDRDQPLASCNVECEGRTYYSPLRVDGALSTAR